MKKFHMLFLSVTGLFTAFSAPASAQSTTQTYIIDGSNFWIAVLSGLFLAFAFQTLMTALSFAMGISLTPNLKESWAKYKSRPTEKNDPFFNEDDDDDFNEGAISTRMKIVNGLGLWSMGTTSIALFAASWIAVRFNYIALDASGLLIGLVVWALFLTLMTYIEIKSVRSLTGGLVSVVSAGLEKGTSSLKAIFGKSDARHAENISRRTVRGIYEELSRLDRKKHLGRDIERYLGRLMPDLPDYKQIQRDIRRLVKDIKIKEKYDVTHDDMTRELSLKLKRDHSYMNRNHVEQFYAALARAFDGAEHETSVSGKIAAAADALAPINDNDAKKYREKLARVLKSTGRAELDPQALKNDIETIVAAPKTAGDVVRARLALFDKDTVKALLAEQKHMDKKKADKAVETVLKSISSLSTKYKSNKTAATLKRKPAAVKSKTTHIPQSAKERIHTYLDSLMRPEISYEAIRHDIEDMMHDPKIAPHILKERLAQMDRDTLVSILASNKHITTERAEDLADRILHMRDDALEHIENVKDKAIGHYENLCRKAVIRAEHMREMVMIAGWWVFITAVISGLAAAAGGLAGVVTVMPPLL